MRRREPAWTGQPDRADAATPDAARAQLVSELRRRGGPLSRSVQQAFAEVPRHLFVPEVGPAAAYRDEAFVIKCGPDGLPVSSSSQPAMMAIMLDQLGLRAGHRVLEIGTGTGYNAAVMSAVVGRRGVVASVDIDAELVARAQASLQAAGYDLVRLHCADGGFGAPELAPFDRIIVTAGAFDIAPAWLDQLGPGGRLVLPLSVRGIQLSIALERTGPEWRSRSAWRCGFVPMLGAFAGPEGVLRLDEPAGLTAQVSDGSPIDLSALRAALAGPVTDVEVPAGLVPADLAALGDLDLWLTLTVPELDRVTILAAPGGWFPGTALLPFGSLVAQAGDPARIGVAMLMPAQADRDGQAQGPQRPGVVVRGFGPGGPALARQLALRAARWPELGRPGARDLRLTVRLGGDGASPVGATTPDDLVLRRRSATIEAGWPAR